MGMGGAIQLAMDATPEVIAEVGVFGAMGQGLKLLAEKEGKSLETKAMEQGAMRSAIIGLAETLADITQGMRLLNGLAHDEAVQCITAIELDALPLIISTVGQALIPTVLGAIGEMMCCTKSIKDSCNKKNEKYKKPRPPPPTTTTTTTTVTRIVTLYKEAEQRGRERTDAMTVEERERLTDAELWAEAVEQFGGKKASAVTPMAPGRSGSSCATNQAKPEAHGQAEIEEQEPFLRPWKECQCQWFCLVWKDFPTGERVTLPDQRNTFFWVFIILPLDLQRVHFLQSVCSRWTM